MRRFCWLLSVCGLVFACSRAPLPSAQDAGTTGSRDLATPGDQATTTPPVDLAVARDLAGCVPNGGTCWQPSQCCSGECILPVQRPEPSSGHRPMPNEGGPGWCASP
jgi:hypothetical protein